MCIFSSSKPFDKTTIQGGVGSYCNMKPIMRDEALNAFKTAIMLCFSSLVCLLF